MNGRRGNAGRISVTLIMIFGILSLIWPSQGALERQEGDQSFETRGRAKTIPASSKFIRLKIIIDGQHTIYAGQFDGGLIRIEKEGSRIYGFVPYIIDQETGDIAIKVFQISKVKKRQGRVVREHMEEVKTLEAGKANDHHFTYYTDTLAHFTIEIIDTKNDSDSTEIAISPQSASECCIECDSSTSCSCAVETRCGSCCHPACCQLF